MVALLAAAFFSQPVPPIVPMPQKIAIGSETVLLSAQSKIVRDPSLDKLAVRMRQDLKRFPKRSGGAEIVLLVGDEDSELPLEGYRLQASRGRIVLLARRPAGIHYAWQSLMQAADEAGRVPQMSLWDWPRFGWRGMHLDVSRHFFGVAEIKKYLDYLARYKFNVFHWHLIDDGGWRLEIKKYPKLTDVGAWRKPQPSWDFGTLEFPGTGPKGLYGGFYTQEQVREIVQYAADRFITVVPEIEMPGHCLPALVAYPELGANRMSLGPKAVRDTAYCAGKDRVYAFLEDVLRETMSLFPSRYIHIGGDEVDKSNWADCYDCQAKLKKEGLKNLDELQSYFIKHFDNFLSQHGRVLVGWDEILEGGLAPKSVVMSWRGEEGGIAAAKSGHRVVMSPTSHCYFDYPYSTTSTPKVYGYDPVPAALSAKEGELVMGAQANVWTEWMPTFRRVQEMVFPRMLAMSETLWTEPEKKDWKDFADRLNPHFAWMDRQGIAYHFPSPRANGTVVFFDTRANVELERSGVPGVLTRYTTNGTEPTLKSPAYKGPLDVRSNTTIRAAFFSARQRISDVVTVQCRKAAPRKTAEGVPGLELTPLVGQFRSLPEFSATANNRRIVQSLDLSSFVAEESFALCWEGWFHAKKRGEYRFTLGSDDGSRLWLDGLMVIDADRLQAYSETSAGAHLVPGWYPIRIAYFEGGGAERLELFIQEPGAARRKFDPSECRVMRP
ncbi:MAG: hypothetical protein HONBIEJF_00438 [Fimbriimonadaceae bacterium]|nr:hypothetical protein [Fimbriimonadaceae bacterium]